MLNGSTSEHRFNEGIRLEIVGLPTQDLIKPKTLGRSIKCLRLV